MLMIWGLRTRTSLNWCYCHTYDFSQFDEKVMEREEHRGRRKEGRKESR